MGYALADWCYSDAVSAASQVCATAYPVQAVSSAGALVSVSCTGLDVSGYLLLSRSLDGGTPVTFSQPVAFSSCDPLTYPSSPAHLSIADGSIVAGAVASVFLAAWAWRAIYKALNVDSASED